MVSLLKTRPCIVSRSQGQTFLLWSDQATIVLHVVPHCIGHYSSPSHMQSLFSKAQLLSQAVLKSFPSHPHWVLLSSLNFWCIAAWPSLLLGARIGLLASLFLEGTRLFKEIGSPFIPATSAHPLTKDVLSKNVLSKGSLQYHIRYLPSYCISPIRFGFLGTLWKCGSYEKRFESPLDPHWIPVLWCWAMTYLCEPWFPYVFSGADDYTCLKRQQH